jgi:flagellar hook-basal body complex protein FliE
MMMITDTGFSAISAQSTGFDAANVAFNAKYKSVITKSNLDAIPTDTLKQVAQGQEKGQQSTNNSSVVGGTLSGFGDALKTEMQKVNLAQLDANANMQDFATGGDVALHQVMLSINKAELSLQLASQVRNKIVNAYQDISRMQI